MFKTNVRMAFRHLRKQPGYSLLHILGLSVGMACFILVMLFVSDELGYDRFHQHAERIHRLTVTGLGSGSAITRGPVLPLIKENVPEVKEGVRFYSTAFWSRSILISHADKHFFTNNLIMADPSIFDVFTFKFLQGSPETAFPYMNSIAISRPMAERYFPGENPLEKILTYDKSSPFTVTAVFESLPRQSHFHCDFIIPLENYGPINNYAPNLSSWGNSAFISYLKLIPGTSPRIVQDKITALIEEKAPEGRSAIYALQPLTGIHLNSNFDQELENNGSMRNVLVFSLTGFLVMVIAGINYINLSTAGILKRSGEIGIRKVVGANRGQLIQQMLVETFLIFCAATALTLSIVVVSLPIFQKITGKIIPLTSVFNAANLGILAGGLIVLTLMVGIFPAWLVTALPAQAIFSNRFCLDRRGGDRFRRILVIFQFVTCIALFACALIINSQMAFTRNKDLGFVKEQLVVIPTLRNPEAMKAILNVKEEVCRIPSVLEATVCSHTPGYSNFFRQLKVPGNPDQESFSIMSLWTDSDYARTYQLRFVAGRDFSEDIVTDRDSACLLNESAVMKTGLGSPQEAVGKRVVVNEKERTVIGVVKDFHFTSLHQKLFPIILWYNQERFQALTLLIDTGNVRATLGQMKQAWHSVLPTIPFNFFFLSEFYDQQYRREINFSRLLNLFTMLALFISCLGLLGMAIFSTQQRTKEIGIRKILGSTTGSILWLLCSSMIRGILIAILIAAPIGWLVISNWLNGFAYRIPLRIWPFLLASIASFLIALMTVSVQTLKAARANPVESLRYE
jgi:putative ABC transport system permease protein